MRMAPDKLSFFCHLSWGWHLIKFLLVTLWYFMITLIILIAKNMSYVGASHQGGRLMNKQSVSSGFTVLTIGALIVKVLSVFYMIILTLILGKYGYGVYSAVYIVYVFIYVVTNSGISVATAKIISELVAKQHYRDARKSFKMILLFMSIVGLLMTLGMYFFAKPLSVMVKFPKAYIAIKVLAPAIFFTSILSVYRGYFQGRGNMIPTTVSQIMEQIINIAFSLGFAAYLMKYGIEAGCAGATIGTSLGAFVAILYLMAVYRYNASRVVKKSTALPFKKGISTRYLVKKILRYGIPITFCLGIQNAGSLIDMANVEGRLLASGFSEGTANALFGIIGQYNTLINVPITIISALSMALLPSISAANVLGHMNEIKRKITYSLRVSFIISLPTAFGLSILSKPIYKMLYPSMAEGYKFMLLGSVVVVLWSVVIILTTVLQGMGMLYTSALFTLIGIIFKVLINYKLVYIKSFNIYGALVGNIVYFLIPLILNYLLLRKKLRSSLPLLKIAFKPLIASIIMGLFIYPADYILNMLFGFFMSAYLANAVATALTVIIGVFTYAYALAVTKGINSDDLNLMPAALRRFIPKILLKKISNAA